MPALKGNQMPSLGISAAARAFYAPVGEHETVACPDCGQRADPVMGGDHGGDCLEAAAVALPGSALGIIHRFALMHAHFSAEQIRAELEAHGIKPSARGPAFGHAQRKQYIEQDGFERSTGETAKRAHLQTYKSLIYKPRTAVQHAKETP